MYYCPMCESKDLEVLALTRVKLIQRDDEVETEAVDSEHEWDHDSLMHCQFCNFCEAAHSFYVEDNQ